MSHANKQENITHDEKKHQSIYVHRLSNDPKDRFIDKSVKIFVTIFHMCKKVEKGINVLSRDMEAIIKTQIKLLEMQNMIYEIKIHWVKLTAELQKN